MRAISIFVSRFLLAACTPLSLACAAADVVTDRAPETSAVSTVPSKEIAQLKCPRYKVYYIDPSAQFFTPPVPLEDHAEFIFCSEHANLDEIRAKLKKMKPVRSQADADSARIKVVLRGNDAEAMTFCSTGEITYKEKQYRMDRRTFEPSLLSIREEGDRQRQMAIESEDDGRDPASVGRSGSRAKRAAPTPAAATN